MSVLPYSHRAQLPTCEGVLASPRQDCRHMSSYVILSARNVKSLACRHKGVWMPTQKDLHSWGVRRPRWSVVERVQTLNKWRAMQHAYRATASISMPRPTVAATPRPVKVCFLHNR
jgi:hypothetical protein